MRTICFYLPQFHPIPENDRWWGAGFTEWTNVRKSAPRFTGHYQPHVPSQLGYYDLRNSNIKEQQAALAREYGIHGFCYYHYWFNGKHLLETPINQVLETGNPDFPFCLCWANENWTRRWDGGDREILITQRYGIEDDRCFIRSLLPAFRDERYIRINGKPLLVVYSSELMPSPKQTTEIWRSEMRRAGIGDLYLARIEKRSTRTEPHPHFQGFDAAIEFAPNWGSMGAVIDQSTLPPLLNEDATFTAYDYEKYMYSMLGRAKPDYKLFRGVFPSWDNSARRKRGATVFLNSSPAKYAFWLSQAVRYALEVHDGDEQLVFINAWNEWAEGCHLEPDQRYGLEYLEATRKAITVARNFQRVLTSLLDNTGKNSFPFESWYSSLDNFVVGNEGGYKNLLEVYRNFIEFQMVALLARETQQSVQTLLKEKEQQVLAMKNTLSWKLTEPLRKIGKIILNIN